MHSTDTIAAIATPHGRGGVGIVRISGRHLASLASTLAGGLELRPRHAHFTRFLDEDGSALDEGLLLYFPAPHSFTGEDVIELQGHGGPVVMQLLLQRCLTLGARPAEPGEFTRRAFLNGKLDLAQAEAVADLIDAASQAAARSALKSLEGGFSARIKVLNEQLIQLRMLVEATLDFPDEEIDFLQAADAFGRLQRLLDSLDGVLRSATQGARLREGLRVVLVGPPNVGKSSLLNALAGEERAIVTDIAGTTRDAIRETLILHGVPVHVVDTAGLRETSDVVEQLGIARTHAEIARADVVLLLSVAGEAEEAPVIELPASAVRVHVINKIDLVAATAGREECAGEAVLRVCARTGDGIDLLQAELLRIAGWSAQPEDVFLARARHVEALERARQHVAESIAMVQYIELMAEELRAAQHALGEITGEFSADDLLGVIFSEFCIGK